MNTKKHALDLHLAHPDWTSHQIAHETGMSPETIRRMFGTFGIALPSEFLRRQRVREAIAGKPRKPFKRIPYAGKA